MRRVVRMLFGVVNIKVREIISFREWWGVGILCVLWSLSKTDYLV
jgi:hypothetical protein